MSTTRRPLAVRGRFPAPGRRGPAILLAALLSVAGLAACSSTGQTGASGAPVSYAPEAGPPGGESSGGGAPTVADGLVPDGEGLSPFADVPAITRLDARLREAVQDAARDAADDGVRFHVTSGWRSATYQQALFDEAVARYGSPAAARAHVLRPDESDHVTGTAVDIGPTDATSWLAQHGSDYGLCQSYANEMWHFELAVERGGDCPAPAPDASAG